MLHFSPVFQSLFCCCFLCDSSSYEFRHFHKQVLFLFNPPLPAGQRPSYYWSLRGQLLKVPLPSCSPLDIFTKTKDQRPTSLRHCTADTVLTTTCIATAPHQARARRNPSWCLYFHFPLIFPNGYFLWFSVTREVFSQFPCLLCDFRKWEPQNSTNTCQCRQAPGLRRTLSVNHKFHRERGLWVLCPTGNLEPDSLSFQIMSPPTENSCLQIHEPYEQTNCTKHSRFDITQSQMCPVTWGGGHPISKNLDPCYWESARTVRGSITCSWELSCATFWTCRRQLTPFGVFWPFRTWNQYYKCSVLQLIIDKQRNTLWMLETKKNTTLKVIDLEGETSLRNSCPWTGCIFGSGAPSPGSRLSTWSV